MALIQIQTNNPRHHLYDATRPAPVHQVLVDVNHLFLFQKILRFLQLTQRFYIHHLVPILVMEHPKNDYVKFPMDAHFQSMTRNDYRHLSMWFHFLLFQQDVREFLEHQHTMHLSHDILIFRDYADQKDNCVYVVPFEPNDHLRVTNR